jgi:DNA invertase Pin-like site-specific DNA recombinase
LRLSKEDDAVRGKSESNSIANQKTFLAKYAKKNNFKNVRIFIDDGVSGVTFNRNGFQELFNLIERNLVSTLIVKDMSRLGRNYIEVGRLTENVFPLHDVRFIAVNDGIDTSKGEDDFTPFRNIINEWYAKDMSRKMRCTLRLKSEQGYAIGQPPFGYKYASDDHKLWEIDEEAAEIVKMIYTMRQNGTSTNKIAKILKQQKATNSVPIRAFKRPSNPDCKSSA